MKIAFKLPLIFILYSLLTLLVVYGISLKSRDFLQQETMNAITNEAELLTQLIDRNMFERYKDTQSFSLPSYITEKNWQTPDNRQVIVNHLNKIARNYKLYNHLVVFDAQGNIVAANTDNGFGKSVPSLTFGAQWVREQPWFKAILARQTLVKRDANGVYVSGPQRAYLRDWEEHYDLLFAKPLLNTQGYVVGGWVNVVDFSVIETIVADTYSVLSNRGWISTAITLLDAEGNIIIDYDPVGQNSAVYKREFSILGQLNLVNNGVAGAKLAVAGLSGANISVHSRKQVEQVTGYAHSQGVYDYPGQNWSALIRIDVDEAFADAAFLQRLSLVSGIILMLVILVSALYVSFNFASPLRKIARAVVGLADGQTELTLPLVKTKDEVGEMSAAVSLLKEKLIERDKLQQQSVQQRLALDIQLRAIDATTSGLIITDMQLEDQPVIFVNRAFQQITGYQSDDVIGKNCRFLQAEDTEQSELMKLRQAIVKGVSCTVELRNYRKDGSKFLNKLRIDPVYNDDKLLTHYIGVLNDITDENLQAEMRQFSLEQEIEQRTQQSRDSENKLRAIFNSTRDGTLVMADDGKIVDINHSGELIFGYKRQQVVEQDISLLLRDSLVQFPSANSEKDTPTLANIISLSGNSTLIKVVGIHQSGREFPAEISIGVNYFTDVETYVISVRDTTEKESVLARERKLKEELVQNEVLYRTAFTQAAIGMAHIATNKTFIKVNEKLCAILGFEESELISLHADDISYTEDVDITSPLIEQVMSGKTKSFSIDKRYVTKQGNLIWINLTMSLVRGSSEEDDYFIAIFENINERKMSETALSQAKVYQEELLLGLKLASDAGGICNWKYNLQTEDIEWDDSMYLLYDVPTDYKITHEFWLSKIHPEDREECEYEFRQAIELSSTFRHSFRIIRHQQGDIRWVMAAADMVLDDENYPIKLFGINTDITSERNTQEALARESHAARQANEAKSRFLAMMSHELRTPMNGVVGMIDLLRQTSLEKEQMRMVKTIRDSSLSLLHIINDVLDFSKIESGQMELELKKTSLLGQIESTLEAVWLSAKNNNVTLLIEHDFNLPRFLLLDSVRLRQILMNLLGNAIKFTASDFKSGYVWVKTKYLIEEQRISISVIDTGVGMTAEQIDNLFKPFTQADISTTRKYGGTGLGLSITKSFTDLMGGDIAVTSTPDKGSAFTVNLPVRHVEDSRLSDRQYDFNAEVVALEIKDKMVESCCVHLLEQLGMTVVSPDPKTHPYKLLVTDNNKASETALSDILVLQLIDDQTEVLGCRSEHIYGIRNYPLKPSDFVFGLAVLLGLESPDVKHSAQEIHSKGLIAKNTEFNGTILCVEDQQTNQLVLSKQLEKLGYRYHMCDNGEVALYAWKTGQFSVVLTDCHMPIMDGFELTNAIRSIEQQQQVVPTLIIAITANVMAGEEQVCKNAGMDDYIGKPVELSALSDVLYRHLNSSKSEADKVVVTDVDEPVIDFAHLEQIVGSDDQSLLHEILKIFWDSLEADIKALKRAVSIQDIELLRTKAHGAKGACTSTGALKLGEFLDEIEQLTKQKNPFDFSDVDLIIGDIDAVLKRLKQQLYVLGVIED